MSESSNSYEQERRAKRDKLRELGVDPYGGRETGLRPLAEIKSSYTTEMGHDGGPVVKAAGRVVLKRDMGKLSFLSLRDESGDLQVALDKKRLNELAWQVNDLIDLGDQIVVEGPLGVTKKGEVTIWATGVRMAAKALLTPPGKWDGLSDVELRYRQRYVDLWANPDVMRMMKLRMQIVDEIRRYLRDRGFLEVETPMMQTLAGGAAARPFETHHNALDIPLYMRIAPELYLKRLLVGGFTKVFELNRNFRNEGISPKHNPEFTMLEAYEAFGSWETMADLVEGMICHIAEKLFGGLKIEHKNAAGEVTKTINLERPWRRARMADLVEEATGWRFDKRPLQEVGQTVYEKVTHLFSRDLIRTTVGRINALESRLNGRLLKASRLPNLNANKRFGFLRIVDKARSKYSFIRYGDDLLPRTIHRFCSRTYSGTWMSITSKSLSPAERACRGIREAHRANTHQPNLCHQRSVRNYSPRPKKSRRFLLCRRLRVSDQRSGDLSRL